MNEYIKSTVATVKQHFNMKEAALSNGPEGTVSKNESAGLVGTPRTRYGTTAKQLEEHTVNEDYLGDVYLRMLLTTIVENLGWKPNFRSFTVCSRLWDNCKRIIKKNDKVERQILYTWQIIRFIQFQHLVWSWQMLKWWSLQQLQG